MIQPVDEHDLASFENEAALIRKMTQQDFRLAAFRVGNWNKDLSPWKAPAVFGRACYQTDLFQGAAAASPSLWFPGFEEFMKTHEIRL